MTQHLSQTAMKRTLQAYVDLINAGDAGGVTALQAPIEDFAKKALVTSRALFSRA